MYSYKDRELQAHHIFGIIKFSARLKAEAQSQELGGLVRSETRSWQKRAIERLDNKESSGQ